MQTAEVRPSVWSHPVSPLQRRRSFLFGAKVILGITILVAVMYHIDRTRLAELVKAVDPKYILLSILALCFGVMINAHRWMLVTLLIGHPIKLGTSIRGCFEAMMFNQILPSSVGGDTARVICAVNTGVGSGWAIIGVMVDRALGLCILALCLLPASFIGMSSIVGTPTLRVLVVTSAVLLGGAVGAVALGAVLGHVRAPSWAQAPVSLLRAFQAVVVSRFAPVLLADLVLTTALTLLSFVLCAEAVHVTISWLDALIVVQGMTLASVLPASIGGWGVREGAAVLLLAPLGVTSSQAVAISVLFGLSITALGLIGCGFWLFGNGPRRATSLKKLSAGRRR